MTNTEHAKQQTENQNISQAIASEIAAICPEATIYPMTDSIMVLHPNQSISSVFPITQDLIDFATRTFTDETAELKDLSLAKCLAVLKKVDALKPTKTEQTTTDQVAPQTTYRDTFYDHTKQWWADGSKYPVGSDLKENSNALHQSANDLVQRFRELLSEDSKIEIDDAGNVNVQREVLKVVVQPCGGNLFDITTYILKNGEWTIAFPKRVQINFASAVKYVFDSIETLDKIETTKPIPYVSAKDSAEEEYEEEDLDSFMQSGQNRMLIGDTKKYGAPVSINENRDISRPYSNTLGDKVLVDLGFPHGVQLVDKKDVPKRKFLSNSPEGVVFVEGMQNVNYKRPQWRGWGRSVR